jgi:hypothetical protein
MIRGFRTSRPAKSPDFAVAGSRALRCIPASPGDLLLASTHRGRQCHSLEPWQLAPFQGLEYAAGIRFTGRCLSIDDVGETLRRTRAKSRK